MVQDDVFKHKIHRQVLCSSGDARAKQRTYLFQLLHRKEGCGMQEQREQSHSFWPLL